MSVEEKFEKLLDEEPVDLRECLIAAVALTLNVEALTKEEFDKL